MTSWRKASKATVVRESILLAFFTKAWTKQFSGRGDIVGDIGMG
jgi:hypothetical protein